MNKFSFVLVGLVVSLSFMVSVAAYFSTNQAAFVSATVSLNIDFGNVFPGQEVTESFTITSLDSSDYVLTVDPPTEPPGVLDIRPYITVWKDPIETDEDGPVSGNTGTGSFTFDTDLSDKWFVTFNVPDVTLDAGVGYDYGCKISITPVISPPPLPEAPAQDLVLRPNAIGNITDFEIKFPTEGFEHWQLVDESGSHDGDVSYVGSAGNEKIDLYGLQDWDLPIEYPIFKITLYAVMKGNGTDMTNGYFGLKTNGGVYWGQSKALLNTYSLYSRPLINNPSTNSAWTVADIDALQVGFYVDNAASSGMFATQVYVVVDVTP